MANKAKACQYQAKSKGFFLSRVERCPINTKIGLKMDININYQLTKRTNYLSCGQKRFAFSHRQKKRTIKTKT